MKQILTHLATTSCLLLLAFSSHAQDAHFSQPLAVPAYTNPAFTGHLEGSYRINAAYRMQWNPLQKGYTTQALGADFNLLHNQMNGKSLGLGIQIINSQAANNTYNDLSALLTAAYHIPIDRAQKHFFSVGAQGALNYKRLRTDQLTFETQFNGEIIDPSLPNYENITQTSILSPDFNAGFVWASYLPYLTLKLGGNASHLLQPQKSFLQQPTKYPILYSGILDTQIKVSPKVRIGPTVQYTWQQQATQLLLAANLQFQINPSTKLLALLGARANDAALAGVGIELLNTRILATYDLNTTQLSGINEGIGALEITATYTGQSQTNITPTLPAIRFF